MISSIRSLLCAFIYGVMENRLFFESHDDPWLFKHFKSYHLWMCLLFITIAVDSNPLIWLWNSLAMPLVQDFTWQVIEPRKMSKEDWSNLTGTPLVLGVYLWYWIVLVVLILLGLVIVR